MKKLTDAVLLVGTPTATSDLRYVTGFSGVDAVVCLVSSAGAYLVVPLMELGRARREVNKGVRVLTPGHLVPRKGDERRLSAWVLGLLRHVGVRRVRVPPAFPLGIARRLEGAGIVLRVARRALFPERAEKTAMELKKMRVVQRAAVAAMRAAVREIARARTDPEGYLVVGAKRLTAEDVRRIIDGELLSRNCVAPETIVACGALSADPHEPGHGPLRAGQPIVIDIFPRHRAHGYWGDLTRTVVRGRSPEAVRKMFAAVKAAQQAGLAQMRAGAAVGKIHHTVEREFSARGFKTTRTAERAEGFTHSTGHGVGLDIHERPSVGAGRDRLKKGNVVTIEPGLYYRGVGGVRIEDVVVVTARGWRYLATMGKRLEV
ncbi:MAG: M24 family metallopeptidase [Verrucomicrobiota bacterium]